MLLLLLLLHNIQFFLSNIILTLPHYKQRTNSKYCMYKTNPISKTGNSVAGYRCGVVEAFSLLGVDRYLVTNVLGQPIRPILQGLA